MPHVEMEVHLRSRRQVPQPVPAALRQRDAPQRLLAADQSAVAVAQAFEVRDQARDSRGRAEPVQVAHHERTRELPRVGLGQRTDPPRHVPVRRHRKLREDVDRCDQVEAFADETLDRALRQRRRRPPSGQGVAPFHHAGDVERHQPDVGEAADFAVHGPRVHDVHQHHAPELPAECLERDVEEQPRADDERAAAPLAPRRRFQEHLPGVLQVGAPGVPAAVAPRAQGPQLPDVAHPPDVPRHRNRQVVEPGPKGPRCHRSTWCAAIHRNARSC